MRARLFLLAALLGGLASACGGEAPEPAELRPASLDRIAEGPHDVAVIDLGELGRIRIELLPELAPEWVAMFAERARAGGYDGTTFHRVIPGFMIQGGNPLSRDADPRNDTTSTDEEVPPHELSDYPQVRGTVAMANRGERNPGSVQFFIVHADSRHLDGGYTVIGRVVEGMEVVDAITRLEIDTYGRWGPRDRPYPVDARIERVRIESAAEPAEALAASGGNG